MMHGHPNIKRGLGCFPFAGFVNTSVELSDSVFRITQGYSGICTCASLAHSRFCPAQRLIQPFATPHSSCSNFLSNTRERDLLFGKACVRTRMFLREG